MLLLLLLAAGWPRQHVVLLAVKPRLLAAAGERWQAAARVARGERLAGPRVVVWVVEQQALTAAGLMTTPLVMPWTINDEQRVCRLAAGTVLHATPLTG